MTKGLSKSRYTAFCQCPKNLWLKMYKPDEATVDTGVEASFESDNEVGDLTMGLFGPPPLLRTRHLGYGKSLGETERGGGVN